ncbi:hypothetical protein [Bifidobacterium longum]|nr:hypothetical protein [Bifidobacterium longum]
MSIETIRPEGLSGECFDRPSAGLEFVAGGRPVEWVVRRTPWTGRPWTTS